MPDLIKNVLEDMDKQLDRIIKSINPLDDDLIWKKMKDSMNSIGNLCLHLAGNEYQNLISAIGNKPFIRERTREFNSEGGISKGELISVLMRTRSESVSILSVLSDEDLKEKLQSAMTTRIGTECFGLALQRMKPMKREKLASFLFRLRHTTDIMQGKLCYSPKH